MRNSSFESEAWKASAAPWKLLAMLAGSPTSRPAAAIASTAAPREAPGARLKETVAAGNCPRWLTASGADSSRTVAMAESGTCPLAATDEGR